MRNLRSLALLSALFSTACAAGPSDGDRVLVVDYTPAFQRAIALELSAMPPECPRNVTPPRLPKSDGGQAEACSPVRTLITDYKHLRDRLRAE